MLQNAYFLAKIGADTAENELHFAEILPMAFGLPFGLAFGLRHAVLREPRGRKDGGGLRALSLIHI